MSKGKKTTYSPAFKEEAVQPYLEGGRSYQQLTDELGLKDKKTLRRWVAQVQRGESLEDRRGKATGSRRGGLAPSLTPWRKSLLTLKRSAIT